MLFLFYIQNHNFEPNLTNFPDPHRNITEPMFKIKVIIVVLKQTHLQKQLFVGNTNSIFAALSAIVKKIQLILLTEHNMPSYAQKP